MQIDPFINRCIRDTLSGLREGLSLFSGPSRTAVIFSLGPKDKLHICDPQNLMRGYEPILKSIYFDSNDWCRCIDDSNAHLPYNHIESQKNLQLDGLISYGGSSSPVFYQMWFTEHHPNICSVSPTECWLEHAVLRLSHDIANDSSLYTGISGSFLKEYAGHAVRDCIVDKAGARLGLDVQIRIYPLLDAVLGISKTNEEGRRPYGSIVFIEPRSLDEVEFLAKFEVPEQPALTYFKHVRKLLQAVEYSDRALIANGVSIVGIAEKPLLPFHITADFQGKFGFLSVDDEKVCSFQDGSFSSNTHRAKLFEMEEALLDFPLEPSTRVDLFKIVSSLVHNAEDNMYGCTFVVDLASEPTAIAGQSITPPIDLKQLKTLALAAGLAKVDGALHIGADLHLHGFACLLDGPQVENEDRARGARYNSALRFTAQHKDVIVVVVSSDRPVSIFLQGKEIVNRYSNASIRTCTLFPTPLENWLEDCD
ncbi:diadenylate cyclase [Desulforhopalus sp. IMCC35007]|uniref:diadenylate cyclase n=1 Tax=Desulforhopalus sp. IMCC35007 TaxID=2569543 RepID=UPI002687C01C